MKIAVLMKQVPNEDAAIKIESEGKSIIEDNVTFITNEPDTYGLEEALLMKDKMENIDEVVVCTMGAESAQQTIKDALAKGADRGIFINNSEQRYQDPLYRAKIIAKVLESERFDVILSGLQSDDDGYAQLGILLAELMNMNHASLVMGAEFIDNETVKVKRELESGWFQWSELKLPVSLTIQSGLNQPRYASLKGIMGVKKKTIDSYNFNDLQIEGKSQTELIRLFNPEKTKVTKFLEGTSDEIVEQLVDVLKNDVKVI